MRNSAAYISTSARRRVSGIVLHIPSIIGQSLITCRHYPSRLNIYLSIPGPQLLALIPSQLADEFERHTIASLARTRTTFTLRRRPVTRWDCICVLPTSIYCVPVSSICLARYSGIPLRLRRTARQHHASITSRAATSSRVTTHRWPTARLCRSGTCCRECRRRG